MKKSLVVLLIGMMAVSSLTACGDTATEVEPTGAVTSELGKQVKDTAKEVVEDVADEDPAEHMDSEDSMQAEEFWSGTDLFYGGKYVMTTDEYIVDVPSTLRMEVDDTYAALQMKVNDIGISIVSVDGMNYVDFADEKYKFPVEEETPTAADMVGVGGIPTLNDNMTFIETDGSKDLYTAEITTEDGAAVECDYTLDRELGGVSSIKIGSTVFDVEPLSARTYTDADFEDYEELPEGKSGKDYLLSSFFGVMVLDDMGVEPEVEEEMVPDSEADAGLNPVEEVTAE